MYVFELPSAYLELYVFELETYIISPCVPPLGGKAKGGKAKLAFPPCVKSIN